MLNSTRLKVYINAYNVRLNRGESIEKIDNDYLNLKRLKKEDIEQIHKAIGL